MKENKIYSDSRGKSYTANNIKNVNGKLYYCGFPVKSIESANEPRFKSKYNIYGKGNRLGEIALSEVDASEINSILNNVEIEFTKVNHDTNGNPRYVCHFLRLLNVGDNIKAQHNKRDTFSITTKYELALNKARSIGGRKFHNKQYGGGIVFQSYNVGELQESIEKIKEVNTEFIKEWTPKDFKRIDRAIYNHFSTYTYNFIDDHSKPAKPFTPFNSFNEIDAMLGLAYTSTGAYAGLWICNGIYVMVNDTYRFIGFAINTDGKIIGIVQDDAENEIFIEL